MSGSSLNQQFYQLFIVIVAMEGEEKGRPPKKGRRATKKEAEPLPAPESLQKKQIIPDPQQSDENSSHSWSNEVIEPAIKSMSFRKKRGTRMKELIRGKKKKDCFWEKYQDYFGGDLAHPEEEEDEEDYHASSSGRDQFDSDFDLTDSYVGKRGRKKGTKVKRKRKPIAKEPEDPDNPPKPRGRPGRKKKVDSAQPTSPPEPTEQPPKNQNQEEALKEESAHHKKPNGKAEERVQRSNHKRENSNKKEKIEIQQEKVVECQERQPIRQTLVEEDEVGKYLD